MPSAYITHPTCLRHENFADHPEAPARLNAIEDRMHAAHLYDYMLHTDHPPQADKAHLLRVHAAAYVEHVFASAPLTGSIELDPDTFMNPYTLDAALYGAGATILAVDMVCKGEARNAFCAIRPPGHHAGRDRGAGFCLFNNVAIAAAHALEAHGVERVAIIDFDVHHGDGTEDIFKDEPRVLFCSTFLHPFYPYCGADTVSDHIVNVPLTRGTSGKVYRELFAEKILPALDTYRPQMIFISAGFDSHREDDMGGIGLVEADYVWITEQLMSVALKYGNERIVSVLEGGYNLSALGRSTTAHIKALAQL